MLRILHYVLLSCLYKIYSNILYIASMNSNKIQGTVNAVILSISISIYKTLSQKKKRRKRKETPQKRKWKLCEAEGILQFICLGLRKVLHFPMIGKWGMAVGASLQPISLYFSTLPKTFCSTDSSFPSSFRYSWSETCT